MCCVRRDLSVRYGVCRGVCVVSVKVCVCGVYRDLSVRCGVCGGVWLV